MYHEVREMKERMAQHRDMIDKAANRIVGLVFLLFIGGVIGLVSLLGVVVWFLTT